MLYRRGGGGARCRPAKAASLAVAPGARIAPKPEEPLAAGAAPGDQPGTVGEAGHPALGKLPAAHAAWRSRRAAW
jgi:hypothetical protein